MSPGLIRALLITDPLIIIATIILTVLAVAVIANFSRAEKKVEHTIAHQYTIDEPQFRREMGVLLGPGITEGNHVDAYDNGDEIFPAMLEEIIVKKKAAVTAPAPDPAPVAGYPGLLWGWAPAPRDAFLTIPEPDH